MLLDKNGKYRFIRVLIDPAEGDEELLREIYAICDERNLKPLRLVFGEMIIEDASGKRRYRQIKAIAERREGGYYGRFVR